ncbi:hypothetical protein ACG7TL_002177 [Trametes sanguinea]
MPRNTVSKHVTKCLPDAHSTRTDLCTIRAPFPSALIAPAGTKMGSRAVRDGIAAGGVRELRIWDNVGRTSRVNGRLRRVHFTEPPDPVRGGQCAQSAALARIRNRVRVKHGESAVRSMRAQALSSFARPPLCRSLQIGSSAVGASFYQTTQSLRRSRGQKRWAASSTQQRPPKSADCLGRSQPAECFVAPASTTSRLRQSSEVITVPHDLLRKILEPVGDGTESGGGVDQWSPLVTEMSMVSIFTDDTSVERLTRASLNA